MGVWCLSSDIFLISLFPILDKAVEIVFQVAVVIPRHFGLSLYYSVIIYLVKTLLNHLILSIFQKCNEKRINL